MAFGPRKLSAVLAVLAVLATLGVALLFVGERLGIFVLGALQTVSLVGVAYGFVGIDRRERRAHERLRRDIASARSAEVARSAAENAVRLAETAAHLERLADAHTRQADAIREMTDALHQIERSSRTITRAIVTEEQASFAQHESLLGLYHEVRPERALPPTRGWAASPDLLMWLWRHLLVARPRTIVECGSGVSTVVLGAACRHNRFGHVVALEHDERHVEVTRALLAEHGLEQWAEVRFAPLEPVERLSHPWYRLDQLPSVPFDLVLVDGPPAGGKDPLARSPAVDLLPARLAPDGVVVFDDARRGGERTIVERWLELHPEFDREYLRHEKGTVVLRRSSRDVPESVQST